MDGSRALTFFASMGMAFSAHVVAAPSSAPGEAGTTYLTYFGTAVARHSGKFLYRENHVLSYKGDRLQQRVVLYTCADGSAFARKVATYDHPLAPDFAFVDESDGMSEGIRNTDGARSVYFRANRREPEKMGALPQIEGLVADTGFDEFIRSNWQSLMNGKPLLLHFLVPSRLDQMTFQVERLHEESIDGNQAVVFRLRLTGVLGWVLPGIDVSYDAHSRVLVRYDGLSDLHDAAGDNFQTQIDFAAGDRKPVDADVQSAVLQARLAACH